MNLSAEVNQQRYNISCKTGGAGKEKKSHCDYDSDSMNFRKSAEISDMYQTMEKLVPENIWKEMQVRPCMF